MHFILTLFFQCSQESLFLITKATVSADSLHLLKASSTSLIFNLQELFIMYLTKLAQRNGGNEHEVKYADLAAVVQRKDSMEFLHDIVPRKIKFRDYLEIMRHEKIKEDDDIL